MNAVLRRKCGCGGSCGSCGGDRKKLRRSSLSGARAGGEAPPIVHDVLRTPGQPLDAANRAFFEPRFGADLSRVRVHHDAHAAASATAVEALAYTVGNHVVLRSAPSSSPIGRHLLAHELAHTIQQGGGSGTIRIGDPHDAAEREADAVASRVAGGGVSETATSSGAMLRRIGDPTLAPATLTCPIAVNSPSGVMEDVEFPVSSTVVSPAFKTRIATFLAGWHSRGATEFVRVDGYASTPGAQASNWTLSCNRAEAVRDELVAPTTPGTTGMPASMVELFAHGETSEFGTAPDPNQRATIATLAPAAPAPTPEEPTPAPTPPCAVPTTNPGTCSGRNKAYCDAAACFPGNPWLACACRASGEVCQLVTAFNFRGRDGILLDACINFPVSNLHASALAHVKAAWFLGTNSCIWDDWRAAFEAIHDPALPVPSGLTPEWNTAVTACRTHGLGSSDCCHAHVEAEQHAIDHCGPYNSATFGPLPSDIPTAPVCSSIVAAMAPPPAFTGDFGLVADRITYGIGRCC